jgi:hypothetical protein
LSRSACSPFMQFSTGVMGMVMPVYEHFRGRKVW